MKTRNLLILLALASVLAACAKVLPQGGDDGDVSVCTDSPAATVQQGISYVQFSPEAAARIRKEGCGQVLGEAMEFLGISRVTPLFDSGGRFEARHRAEGLDRWYQVEYDPEVSTTKAGSALGALPGVEIVEEARTVQSCGVELPFNDPGALQHQWHLNNDGSLVSGFKSGCDINVLPVWKSYTAGSKDVIVAVLDTGADENHPDLKGVVIPCGENGSKNFLTYYASTPYVIYPGNHGSHVASLIAAINNNKTGGCGVAGGSDGTGGVRILNCQFMGTDPNDASKSLSGSSSAALIWAADHGAVIANNSWSFVYDSESAVPSSPGVLTAAAFDYFIKYAGLDEKGNQVGPMKGGVAFVSAGNKDWSKSQPAMYEPVIAVGACGGAFERASYSNHGDWVDICAPGGYKAPYNNSNAMIYGCGAGTSYYYMQGTSQSCPLVSGVAALIVSQFGGPGFTNTMLKDLILGGANSSVKSFQDKNIGPLVDAGASFALMGAEVPQVTDLKGIAKDKALTLVWSVLADGDNPTYSYVSAISADRAKIENLDLKDIPEGVSTKTLVTSSKKVGAKVTALFSGLSNNTTYYCTVFGRNSLGISSKMADIIEVTPEGNSEPVIAVAEAVGREMQADGYGIASIGFTVTDPEGDLILLKTEPGSAYASWKQTEDGTLVLTVSGKDAEPGSYTASVTASDSAGGSCSKEITYIILENLVPVINL